MSGTHETTFYVEIEPTWYRWSSSEPIVTGLRAAKLFKRRPKVHTGGTALVELTVRIPDAAFLPLRPAAVIDVPENLISTGIEIEARDAND